MKKTNNYSIIKNIKTINFSVFLIIINFTYVNPAHSTLIELDLDNLGDKLVTLDTSTNLEWLDVNATLGFSYNQAQTTTYVTTQGFRHATNDEVSTLYTNNGLTDQTRTPSATMYPFALDLISKLGCTNFCSSDTFVQRGIAEFVPFSLLLAGSPFVIAYGPSANISEALKAAVDPGTEVVDKAFGLAGFGNYLVREKSPAISEPSSLLLLFIGLMAIAVFRRHECSVNRPAETHSS